MGLVAYLLPDVTGHTARDVRDVLVSLAEEQPWHYLPQGLGGLVRVRGVGVLRGLAVRCREMDGVLPEDLSSAPSRPVHNSSLTTRNNRMIAFSWLAV